MSAYAAPLADMKFVLHDVVGIAGIAGLPGYDHAEPDLVDQILEEAGRFAREVLAPLNAPGDRQGSVLENGVVRVPDGFADAWRQFADAGWTALPVAPEHGGQGLPWLVNTALNEIWGAANLSFSLCPLLTQGAIEALDRHADDGQKRRYLEPLASGRWTGTMNLTEPQAGTDLGSIRTRSERDGGHYRIRGQKIFITWGDHEMAENVIHLVLARSPNGPPGPKGLSLFIVPKYLVDADGKRGRRNDLRPVALEHKLGIHASPTCVMAFGEDEGAIGYLVGEENRGIEYMFVMMNNARLAVGLEGLSIAERAYQQALGFARERVQGRPVEGGPDPVAIAQHPDVRRMLLDMKSQIEAMRALCYLVSAETDIAARHPDADRRRRARMMVDLLIPVVKAWCSDTGLAITSTAIQVHGGMGFIEETGAAQHYRDARITTIYEGTNGIQALDLAGRKLVRDGGEVMGELLAAIRQTAAAASGGSDPRCAGPGRQLAEGADALAQATEWMVETFAGDPARGAASATPYLQLAGLVAGGWMLTRAALAARDRLAGANGANGDGGFLEARLAMAQFYASHHLVKAGGLLTTVTAGGEPVLALPVERL